MTLCTTDSDANSWSRPCQKQVSPHDGASRTRVLESAGCRNSRLCAVRGGAGFLDMAFAASPGAPAEAPLTYLLQDEGKWFPLAQFPVATRRINELMPRLLAALQGSPPLRGMLTSVAFLDTLAEDVMVVTLVYKGEGRLDDAWLSAATATAAALGVHFVGRCRGGSVVVGRNHVIERLTLRDGRTLLYKQVGIEDGGSGWGEGVGGGRQRTERAVTVSCLVCLSLLLVSCRWRVTFRTPTQRAMPRR